MIDQDFYSHLEYKLTKAFPLIDNDLTISFWCDGILPVSEEEISSIGNEGKNELKTTAFIGKDGQENYEITILFGPKALNNYSRGRDLKDCIPDILNDNWIDVNVIDKRISVRLL
jgi:hypothetical protein